MRHILSITSTYCYLYKYIALERWNPHLLCWKVVAKPHTFHGNRQFPLQQYPSVTKQLSTLLEDSLNFHLCLCLTIQFAEVLTELHPWSIIFIAEQLLSFVCSSWRHGI